MKIKFLSVMSVLFFTSGLVCAQDGSEFVIKKVDKTRSMSKNQLKEEIGSITRRAFNSTTALGRVVGGIKINLSDDKIGFYTLESGKIASVVDKNDGVLQIELANIQSSFSEVISNLVENRGFFKRASRGDLRELLNLIQDAVTDLNAQADAFNALKVSINTATKACAKEPTFFEKIKQQFCSAAGEMKKLQEKIKGTKCLKKA